MGLTNILDLKEKSQWKIGEYIQMYVPAPLPILPSPLPLSLSSLLPFPSPSFSPIPLLPSPVRPLLPDNLFKITNYPCDCHALSI